VSWFRCPIDPRVIQGVNYSDDPFQHTLVDYANMALGALIKCELGCASTFANEAAYERHKVSLAMTPLLQMFMNYAHLSDYQS